MRLRRELVEHMAGRMAAGLLDDRLVSGVALPVLAGRLASALLQDLAVEDRLNAEVREIMRQHAADIDRGGVEVQELFKKIKAKLVRDRKLIL